MFKYKILDKMKNEYLDAQHYVTQNGTIMKWGYPLSKKIENQENYEVILEDEFLCKNTEQKANN